MGLAGSPHCLAMCGAASTGVCRGCTPAGQSALPAALAWSLGRVLAYAGLGALLGAGTQWLAWAAQAAPVLRPAWTLFHVAVLMLGLALVWRGRQPAWVDAAVARVGAPWRRWAAGRPGAQSRWAGPRLALGAGVLWGGLPCGLLYAALMVAALSGGAWQGAVVMGAFALVSGAVVILVPLVWDLGLRARGHAPREDASAGPVGPVIPVIAARVDAPSSAGMAGPRRTRTGAGPGVWGVRVAGIALAAASAWALWHGVGGGALDPWC